MRLETDFMRALLRREAPHVAYPSITLNEIQRQGVRALYTFFRISRDTIDKAASKAESQVAVQHLNRMFEESNADEAIDEIPDLGLAWEAWLGLEEEFGVPRAYALEFTRGLRMEAESYRPETIEDLLAFSYRTGGVLGLVVCHILNVPVSAMQSMVDAGSAARLTSLASGIKKDFELGRCFVPLEWYSRVETARLSSAWSLESATRLEKLAAVLYKSSRNALDVLPLTSRLTLSVAIVLHREARASRLRKLDRAIDEVLRQCASVVRKQWVAKFGRRPLEIAAEHAAHDARSLTEGAPIRLPQHNLAFTLRSQNFRLNREL